MRTRRQNGDDIAAVERRVHRVRIQAAAIAAVRVQKLWLQQFGQRAPRLKIARVAHARAESGPHRRDVERRGRRGVRHKALDLRIERVHVDSAHVLRVGIGKVGHPRNEARGQRLVFESGRHDGLDCVPYCQTVTDAQKQT